MTKVEATVPTGIDLTGLELAPSQTWGAIRLVPLLRAEPITDLRLHPRLYGEDLAVVLVEPRTVYVSYVPHAFVAVWTRNGQPAAAYGTQLRDPRATRRLPSCVPLRFHRRMARRAGRDRLRFLPQHLALDGYLALHFGGPEVAWEEWSRHAIAQGLSPRCEAAYAGAEIQGLDDALRVFEIHPGQCGMLLFVADALAGAFVVPHPDDYRALHATLLQDLYGELLYLYALSLSHPVSEPHPGVDAANVRTLADLRIELNRARSEWAAGHVLMAGGLLDQAELAFERVYRMGRFTLWRFLPSFDPHGENHIGESITDPEGRLAYLKTFRLSAAQTRRGHLLTSLASHGWELDATATALGTDRAGLVQRIDHAGFGHLLRQDILDAYRSRSRKRLQRR